MNKEIPTVYEEICRRASNRSFIQQKLYDIYFKSEGISYEQSNLRRLVASQWNCGTIFIFDHRVSGHLDWSLTDHIAAVRHLRRNNWNYDQVLPDLPTNPELSMMHKCYKQIIAYHETTGLCEEDLTTDI